jgi:hypothetical protein
LSDIFLSYARADVERARALTGALRSYGWSVFWDASLRGGENWPDRLEKELTEARCVVVAWSTASAKSKWVREEATRGAKREVLVPVLLDPVDPPLGFGGTQAIDLTSLEPERLERLAADISRFTGPPPNHPDLDKFAKLPRSVIAAGGLLVLDYACALYAVRVGWHFFVPLGQYLLSPAAWLPAAVPLVLVAPPVRAGIRAVLRKLRTARTRARAGLTAALAVAGLLLGSVCLALRPSVELRVVDHDIDTGDSSLPPFADVPGASIDARNLCEGSANTSKCDAPLPSDGHLQLLIHLGRNGLESYRLHFEGSESPPVAFARVRAPESLWAAATDPKPLSVGRVLEIERGPRAVLTGTVDVRLLCRKVPSAAQGDPGLVVKLTALREGRDGEGIRACWILANGRLGGRCTTGHP